MQRLEASEDRAGEPHDLAQFILCCQLGVALNVAAGTEKPIPGAGDDDRAQVRVALNSVEDVEKRLGDLRALSELPASGRSMVRTSALPRRSCLTISIRRASAKVLRCEPAVYLGFDEMYQ